MFLLKHFLKKVLLSRVCVFFWINKLFGEENPNEKEKSPVLKIIFDRFFHFFTGFFLHSSARIMPKQTASPFSQLFFCKKKCKKKKLGKKSRPALTVFFTMSKRAFFYRSVFFLLCKKMQSKKKCCPLRRQKSRAKHFFQSQKSEWEKRRKSRIPSKEKFLEILSFSIEMSENKFVLKLFKNKFVFKKFLLR